MENPTRNASARAMPLRLGAAVGIGAAALHHEEQGGSQAGNDGDEGNGNKVCHGGHYPVSSAAPGWRFWLVTLAALAGVALTAVAGRLAAVARQLQGSPAGAGRRAAAAWPRWTPARCRSGAPFHRQVIVQGTWLAQHTVFLDNRQMNGKPGFYVLTPLQLEGGGAVVLVQRGWVPRNFADRAALPKVETPAGRVTVQGRIAPAASQAIRVRRGARRPDPAKSRPGPVQCRNRLPLLARHRAADRRGQ